MKILIIEDEPKVSAFIKEGLEENGHDVDVAYDGMIGKMLAFRNNYDVILMDVIMPMINGFELCKEVKLKSPDTLIIIISALGMADDKILGFNAGADDYIVKPFEFRELMARINAVSKRNSTSSIPKNSLKIADLEIDLNERSAIRDGKKILLTAREFALLYYFVTNKGKVLSRIKIAEKVFNNLYNSESNIVDVYVNLLRKKIDKGYATQLIKTRVGIGYIFNDE